MGDLLLVSEGGERARHAGQEPAKRRFRAGQSLELRITAPGYLGKVIRYTIRKGKHPKVTKLCLPPGASKPKATC